MDKEIKETLGEIINIFQTKVVNEGKEKIKNTKLKNNFNKLNDVLKETKEIIQNEDCFEKEDFRRWIGICGIIELDLGHTFHEYISKDLDNLEEEIKVEE